MLGLPVYHCVSVYVVLRTEPKILFMQGTHFASWATDPSSHSFFLWPNLLILSQHSFSYSILPTSIVVILLVDKRKTLIFLIWRISDNSQDSSHCLNEQKCLPILCAGQGIEPTALYTAGKHSVSELFLSHFHLFLFYSVYFSYPLMGMEPTGKSYLSKPCLFFVISFVYNNVISIGI